MRLNLSLDTETPVRIPRPQFGYRDPSSDTETPVRIPRPQFGWDLPRYPNRVVGSRYPNYFQYCSDTETHVLFGYRDPQPCSDTETPRYPNSVTETPVYYFTFKTSVGLAIALDRLPARTAHPMFFMLESSPPTWGQSNKAFCACNLSWDLYFLSADNLLNFHC